MTYPNRRLDPPATAVLDELPNATPLPQLPDIVSDSAGRGVVIHWAAQSMAHLDDTFTPPRARQLLDNTTTLTVFGALKDSRGLEWLSTISGHHDRARHQHHADGFLSPGRSTLGTETVPTFRPGDVRTLTAAVSRSSTGGCARSWPAPWTSPPARTGRPSAPTSRPSARVARRSTRRATTTARQVPGLPPQSTRRLPAIRSTGLGERLPQLEQEFATDVAARFDMTWPMRDVDVTPRVALFVSRYDHCLLDLLWRWRRGQLGGDAMIADSRSTWTGRWPSPAGPGG